MTPTIRTADDALALMRELATYRGRRVLLVGRHGTGRVAFARRVASLLPSFDDGSSEHVEHTWIWHGARLGVLEHARLYRPFRAPHHTCSTAALVGGGAPSRPGELSLAHGGVMLLDDATEFRRHTLDAVRCVLRDGCSAIHRHGVVTTIPARPWCLVATAMPCPCGYRGTGRCRCNAGQLERYEARVADLCARLELERIDFELSADEAQAMVASVTEPRRDAAREHRA